MIDSKTSTTLMRQHAMSVQAMRVFASCSHAAVSGSTRVLRVCSLKCAGKEATNNMYTQAVDCNNKKTLYDNATLKSSTAKDALVI